MVHINLLTMMYKININKRLVKLRTGGFISDTGSLENTCYRCYWKTETGYILIVKMTRNEYSVFCFVLFYYHLIASLTTNNVDNNGRLIIIVVFRLAGSSFKPSSCPHSPGAKNFSKISVK